MDNQTGDTINSSSTVNSSSDSDKSSDKSWIVLLTLSLLVGGLGVDRFYLGKIGTGILKLITLGGFGIWWLIDVILIVTGNMKDGSGAVVKSSGGIRNDPVNNYQ